MKQKNYRDFTVGELLDNGLNVTVTKHNVSETEAKKITSKFEGAKQSTRQIDDYLKVAKMERVKAKVSATATVELIVALNKYRNGDIEVDDVLEILEVDDIDDVEIKSEF